MIEVNELALLKRIEMQRALKSKMDCDKRVAVEILNTFEDESYIEIIPPESEEVNFEKIYAKATHLGRYKGNSYKPGNIIFNIRTCVIDFFINGAEMANAIFDFSDDQPLIGALSVFIALISSLKMIKSELEEKCVSVLAILWENGYRKGQKIEVERARSLINIQMEKKDRPIFSEVEFEDILENLEQFGCVKIDNDKITLVEELILTYDF